MMKKLLAIGLAGSLLLGAALGLRIRQVARRSASLASSAAPQATARVAGPLQIAEVAYDSKLGGGWQDWGGGPHDLPKLGPAKINFAGFGGLLLHHSDLQASFGAFSFRYKTPGVWPEFITVRLQGSGNVFPLVSVEPRHAATEPDGWREVLIDWSELDPNDFPIDGVSIAASTSVSSDWVLLDKIAFTKAERTSVARDTPTRDVELRVDCGGPSRPINPMIYGAAAGDWASGMSAQRLGGNPMTRLNWDSHFANAGNDWFFENGKGGIVADMIQGGIGHAAPTALVVPMIGWVAKDATSSGFPRSKFPKQRKFDSDRPEAGDGTTPSNEPITPGPPTETSVEAPPEKIGRWIRALADADRARGSRGVSMYILDNEPALWSSTHRDVHPKPLTYDELLDRTIRYATEIRNADPGAVIAGPAEWGWNGYLFSAQDLAQDPGGRADRRAHGDVPIVAWYLRRLAEHEKATGKRLLDVLDLHFYPAAPRIYGGDARVDPEGAALRLRSTRGLWDPSYKDESWVNESIRLIPRMKAWIDDNYPGLKTSIGEWSFGADKHISGALATAEALGRFGQQGLDSAFYWGGPNAGTGTFWAFRAYRNFDGKGGRFLDWSLPTHEAEKVSSFASKDESGKHIVLVLVNRDASFAAYSAVRLEGCAEVISRRVFIYSEGSAALSETHADPAAAADSRFVVPPYSIAVVDLHLAP